MPRPARSDVIDPSLPAHVVLRGNNRRCIFGHPTAYQLFLGLLHDSAVKTGCAIHALALMTNHVHLVVTMPDLPSLSRCIGVASQRYASRHNHQRIGSGKLFEQRFEARTIHDQAHLAETFAYVDLNPVRAGLAQSPDVWPWSTYRLHTALAEPHLVLRALWTPHDWYLGLAAAPAGRAEWYAAWVRARRDDELDRIAEEMHDRDDERRGHGARLERPNRSSAR